MQRDMNASLRSRYRLLRGGVAEHESMGAKHERSRAGNMGVLGAWKHDSMKKWEHKSIVGAFDSFP